MKVVLCLTATYSPSVVNTTLQMIMYCFKYSLLVNSLPNKGKIWAYDPMSLRVSVRPVFQFMNQLTNFHNFPTSTIIFAYLRLVTTAWRTREIVIWQAHFF